NYLLNSIRIYPKMKHLALTCLLIFGLSFTAHAQDNALKRVEPMFWWTDMHNTELQVLLYGKNIGNLTPHLDYEGVKVKRAMRVTNDNYLFLYLHISHKAQPGSFEISLMENGQQ